MDDIRDLIAANHREVLAAIRGATDEHGVWHAGLAPQLVALTTRVDRLERIIASCTAMMLAVASTVSGAWALITWGPHK